MNPRRSSVDEIACDCLAARVRVIGRTVTAIYEEALRPHGLTIAQVNLLAALGTAGPCAPTRLAEVVQIERSTMTRNLAALLKSRWVRATAHDAKGVREVELTTAGVKKIDSVLTDWRKAQRETVHLIGTPGVQALREVAGRVWTHAPA